MSCSCYSIQFDRKRAAADLKRYRKGGPDPTTRALIDALSAQGLETASLLDIGAGIGVIHHELLANGLQLATHVDASQPYLDTAREEAERRGHGDRVDFVHGDFVAVAPSVPPADVVTLDRVICCYRDMESLVEASAARARKLWGAVIPHDRWYLRPAFAAINAFQWLMRREYRAYIHPVHAIEAILERQGFVQRKALNTFVWRVVVYSRALSRGS